MTVPDPAAPRPGAPSQRAPLPPPNFQDDTQIPLTGLALVLAITGLIFFMAVPQRPLDAAELALQRCEFELRLALEELRGALAEYHHDHDAWPGDSPRNSRGRGVGAQLPAPPFGPYLPEGVPRNPHNGSTRVRILAPGERMPEGPVGDAGWIYSPATGEIRANVPGHLWGAGMRVFDL